MFDDVNMTRWLLGVLSLVLMFGGLVVILKRYQQNGQFVGFKGLRPQSRLQIGEVLHLDARRKLVLVQDGQTEHLILLGTTHELLVNSRPVLEKAALRPAPEVTTPKAKKAR